MLSYEQFFNHKYEEYREDWENVADNHTREQIYKDFCDWVKEQYKKYKNQYEGEEHQTKNKGFKEQFVNTFLKSSVFNPIPAEITYYLTIALMMKRKPKIQDGFNVNQHYYLVKPSGKKEKVSSLLHGFWSQASSSGKSQGMEFFEKVTKSASKKLQGYYGTPDEFFNIRSSKLADTIESYINTFPQVKTKKGKIEYDFTQEVPGIFEKVDVLLFHESAFIIEQKKGDKQTLAEYLLDALEGKPFYKNLVGWGGHYTTTKPNFIFFGLSRPISSMDLEFLSNGLIQRGLSYFRLIGSKLSSNMLKTAEKSSEMVTDKELETISEELKDIYVWKTDNNINTFKFTDDKYYQKRWEEEMEKTTTMIGRNVYNWSLRDALQSFQRRLLCEHLKKLMILSASGRKSNKITKEDIDNSLRLISELLNSIISFTSETIPISRKEKERRYSILKTLMSLNKKQNGQPVTYEELLNAIQKNQFVSEEVASNIILNLLRESTIIQTGNNQYKFNNKKWV